MNYVFKICSYLAKDAKVQLGQHERTNKMPDNTQFYVNELRGKKKTGKNSTAL